MSTKFYAMPPRAIWVFGVWNLGVAILCVMATVPRGWWTIAGVVIGGITTGGALACLLVLMWRHYWWQWE